MAEIAVILITLVLLTAGCHSPEMALTFAKEALRVIANLPALGCFYGSGQPNRGVGRL